VFVDAEELKQKLSSDQLNAQFEQRFHLWLADDLQRQRVRGGLGWAALPTGTGRGSQGIFPRIEAGCPDSAKWMNFARAA
jgi:hypothetical protein